jgi:UDPglucose 6-dehydrogenase
MSTTTTIIGYGYVGKAIASMLKTPYTIVPRHTSRLPKTDVVFLCVPTPTVLGRCDDSAVMHYVNLVDDSSLLFVKSTVPPSTVKKILEVRPTTIIWPELLRQAYYLEDIKKSPVILGTNYDDVVEKSLSYLQYNTKFDIKDYKKVSPLQASIFKYVVNTFLATKVLFMHEYARYCETNQVSWEPIKQLLAEEGRIGPTHMDYPGIQGPGFSGSCFPKDMEAILEEGNMHLLYYVLETNQRLRDEWLNNKS